MLTARSSNKNDLLSLNRLVDLRLTYEYLLFMDTLLARVYAHSPLKVAQHFTGLGYLQKFWNESSP
jgi:hypothetical protein